MHAREMEMEVIEIFEWYTSASFVQMIDHEA